MQAGLPPGPSYPPLIQGIGLWTRPLAFLERCRARYGKRFTVRFPFTPPFVHLTEPDQVKEIYTAPADVLHPGEGAQVLKPIVGSNSVILLDGDAHMEQRKLMLPAFHGERIERLTGLVEEVAERETSGWRGTLELQPLFQSLTLEIILRAVFGLDSGPRLDDLRERLSTLLAYGDSPITLLPEPSERIQKLFSGAGPLKGFLEVRERIDRGVFELIEERRSHSAGGDDILSMLLEARHEDGAEMSAQEVRDELMTLLIAGHETTASTLSWTFERLSREPAVLATLTDEVRRGNEESYLTATIQETLRRRPVLPNTAPRMVKQPIEVGGWSYPTGVSLVANAYLLHHDADLYPDPYAFRPERFLEEPPGTYSWIPFGGGRRRCLGASFAMLEMKVVIASLLRAFELQPAGSPHEPPRRRQITIRPARGARVDLVRSPDRVEAAA
jgi:cytochrome P450